MTAPQKHWYLIAYDVRDERRLRRVHYYLRKQATAVQKSVFIIHTDPGHLSEVEDALRDRTDPRVDDLRLYAIPGPAAVWAAGAQARAFNGLYGPGADTGTHGIGARLRHWVKGLIGRDAA